jgi:hypothetical protein
VHSRRLAGGGGGKAQGEGCGIESVGLGEDSVQSARSVVLGCLCTSSGKSRGFAGRQLCRRPVPVPLCGLTVVWHGATHGRDCAPASLGRPPRLRIQMCLNGRRKTSQRRSKSELQTAGSPRVFKLQTSDFAGKECSTRSTQRCVEPAEVSLHTFNASFSRTSLCRKEFDDATRRTESSTRRGECNTYALLRRLLFHRDCLPP